MNPAELDGRSLALTLWGKTPEGEDDVVVFRGRMVWDGNALHFEFKADSNEPPARREFRPGWLARLKPSSDAEVGQIVRNADFILPLALGDMPPSVDSNTLERTGLKWPSPSDPDDDDDSGSGAPSAG